MRNVTVGTDRLPPASAALSAYLDDMLRDVAAAAETAAAETAAAETAAAETAAAETAAAETAAAETAALATDAPHGTAATPAGDQSVGGLQVQVFGLTGLRLALPLARIEGVVDSPNLAALSLSAVSWLIGTIEFAGRVINVVNPCGFILPPERQPLAWQPSSVVVLQDSRWGLGCDGNLAVADLEAGEVCWRTAQTRRLWLAGTVSRLGYALVDADALIALFDRESKS
ncbi:MAG: chemotaxis protein CheW [Gammaproteobacteria bacterium]|nr:chemotaxis protein CheW [Gammaproteobacteria bacterium]